jgi:hypothetical protein
MIFSDAALQTLADRLSCGGPAPPQHFQEALEASLEPLIRCALRDGAGPPQLVRWVRTALPRVAAADRGRPVDPDRAAPPLARLLCASLLRGRPTAAAGARETVVGR